jgi:hypothetical protein
MNDSGVDISTDSRMEQRNDIAIAENKNTRSSVITAAKIVKILQIPSIGPQIITIRAFWPVSARNLSPQT